MSEKSNVLNSGSFPDASVLKAATAVDDAWRIWEAIEQPCLSTVECLPTVEMTPGRGLRSLFSRMQLPRSFLLVFARISTKASSKFPPASPPPSVSPTCVHASHTTPLPAPVPLVSLNFFV